MLSSMTCISETEGSSIPIIDYMSMSFVRVDYSDEGLTLETSATQHSPQAYQPLLIKPVFSLLANAEKTVFFKTSLTVFIYEYVPPI